MSVACMFKQCHQNIICFCWFLKSSHYTYNDLLGRVKNSLPTGSSLHLGGVPLYENIWHLWMWHLKSNIFVLFSTFSHYPKNNLLCMVKISLHRGIPLQFNLGAGCQYAILCGTSDVVLQHKRTVLALGLSLVKLVPCNAYNKPHVI